MVKLISTCLSWAIRTFYLRKVTGIENLKHLEGSIISANHASYLDHFIILALLEGVIDRKKIYFLTKKEAFQGLFTKWWHEMMQGISIDRDGKATSSLREIVKHLKQGDVVVIYPEGTRTRTGLIGQGSDGAVVIANLTGAPIIPIGITGAFDALPAKHFWPRKSIVHVAVGSARRIQFKGNRHRAVETQKLMDDIAQLSGEYSNNNQVQSVVDVARFYNTVGIRDFLNERIPARTAFIRAQLLMKQYVKNNPQDEEAWLELGISYARLSLLTRHTVKRWYYQRKAMGAFDESLLINREDESILFAVGRLYHEQKKYERARLFYERALKVNANHFPSRIWLIRIYQKQKEYNLAESLAKNTTTLQSVDQVSQRRQLEALAFLMRFNKKYDYIVEQEKQP
ncbi:lysophospholipid acyltransferase family protein [Fructobacillus durionis]|uniref:1-acyl-sn-glycerol-3-phosphate acyltransferases n=1 Tax=Fructobacillus durionis TaxID=283737 RepID=A0A1I1H9F4_9LACO|nr:lysophospholipid acyltransferase family protein [Fructobacillus durionis]SFC18103.1 1-acyl-sn-glycerol-3-phosphate acyltransferases [Fructobacillus durionis]